MNNDPFKEYIKQSEPNKRDKGYTWHTAIQNIEGEILFLPGPLKRAVRTAELIAPGEIR